IGFNAPTAGPLSAADNLAKIVVGGEAMGFDYATFSDHVVIPTAIAAEYPYSASGEFPSGTRGERHEQLTEIAWIAAKTTRLRLVTSVMVVPHRPAVLTAKILSTIDVLSGGRLTLGIGAGWMREEFEAIDAPDFDARGTVTDEYVRAFVELWTKDAPKFDGKHVRFSNIGFDPKPVQKPHPPIWVGGESGPALRRTARIGDAWYPIGTNPKNPLDSLTRYKIQVSRLRKMTAEAGRDPNITVASLGNV
ncbi:MAG TPA: TIGR03619 family F420-dependent LLM class oxidoreductase, partial [Xanthobacteraceae bacterium]|nr:TIGR03619 family F420-dependent LLM class oxidoreductase [Xanthobacteraceae bacterium]